MPVPNTYSFTKSDYAAMLQHVVDLIPELIFLYDPCEDLVVYHNQKKGILFGQNTPPEAPVSLHRLFQDIVVPEDWALLKRNGERLLNLQHKEILEVRFRIRAGESITGYRWCSFRQKVFWEDELSRVKLIVCLTTEIKEARHPVLYASEGFRYS
jgi:PAS domain-containing protein